MINFNCKEFWISAITRPIPRGYPDKNGKLITRYEKESKCLLHFGKFTIDDGNLTEFAFVKAVLQVFIHGCRKRVTKEGGRIDLQTSLPRDENRAESPKLWFSAQQKDKKHYLRVFLESNGAITNQVYLDELEVIMLDIAISKVINLMKPEVMM
jgi:hypothetical protein